jgi:dATP/dGTP diphosphohydrolase
MSDAEVGRKDDGGKPRYDLIHPSLLNAVATVLEFGSRKYAARNWEKGIQYGRIFGAMMRHLWAWWGGAKYDTESGLSHLHHAACNLHFLIAFDDDCRIELDDRKQLPCERL